MVATFLPALAVVAPKGTKPSPASADSSTRGSGNAAVSWKPKAREKQKSNDWSTHAAQRSRILRRVQTDRVRCNRNARGAIIGTAKPRGENAPYAHAWDRYKAGGIHLSCLFPLAALREGERRRYARRRHRVVAPLRQSGAEPESRAAGIETLPGDREGLAGLVHVNLLVVFHRQGVTFHVRLHLGDSDASKL